MKYKVEEFVLSLEAHKMPIVEAQRRSYRRIISELLDQECSFKNNARAVITHAVEGADPFETEVRIECLRTTCPYCGYEGDLEHTHWRAYVGTKQKLAHVVNEPRQDDPEELDRWFSDYPEGWMPFDEGALVPLDVCEENIERPYGESCPLEDLLADAQQPRLPLCGASDPGISERYGRVGGYKGIYECPHCASAYYAVYNNFDSDTYVKWPRDRGGYGSATQLLGAKVITATVTSTEGGVELRFSPAVEHRVTSIRFDAKRGYTEVDGYQLMKQDVPGPDLARLPLGLSCPQFASYVARCLEKHIANAHRASRLVCESRKEGLKVRGCCPEMNMLDLAFANRLQGYPDELYKNLFSVARTDRASASFGALPVRYADIAAIYDVSGLPQCKSIRRIAFRQPLLISYACLLDRIPFSDPNLLRRLLSDRAALSVLDGLCVPHRGETSVFDYLKETRGELATWNYLKKLVDKGDSFDFLFRRGERRMAVGEAGVFLAQQKIEDAARALSWMFSRGGVFSHGFQEVYSYSQETSQLEGDVGGFCFRLPRTPLDLLKAAAELRNCLADYTDWIDDGWTVLVVSRRGGAVGAVEVETRLRRVVQAKARFNKEIPKGSPFHAALAEWTINKNLRLDLDPWG